MGLEWITECTKMVSCGHFTVLSQKVTIPYASLPLSFLTLSHDNMKNGDYHHLPEEILHNIVPIKNIHVSKNI